MNSSVKITPMPIWMSLLFFGLAAIVLYFATHYIIPLLISVTNIHPALSWFIVGGTVVFIPLFVTAIVASRHEGAKTFYAIRKRLRLKAMNRGDWLWTLVGFIVIGVTVGLIMFMGEWAVKAGLISGFNISPTFLEFEPFGIGQRWMLLVWLPMFFFNIMGEELLWRGYILPRQELAHGIYAWIANCVLWLVFHIPFGWSLILMTFPIIMVIPYLVQKRANTWIGVILHASINGPAFIAITLGWV
ncbi:MAG: CPBP family intramembrane metalloprotease [Dehalococcoidia bacterium]|nr:MAG: CPBP family intramembrane metalloprotease [Dehalococcoidia bacterium]